MNGWHGRPRMWLTRMTMTVEEPPRSPALSGDKLLAMAEHMGPKAAAFVRQWVADWREKDRREGREGEY